MKRASCYFQQVVRKQHSFQQAETSEIAPKSFASIPSPKKLPLLGTLLDYTKYRNFESSQFFELMKRRHADLGPIYKENVIPGLTPFIVHVKSPEDIEAMFRSDPRFPFRPPQEFFSRGREPLGIHSGIVNTQGEEWHKLRKVFNEHLLTSKSVWLYANHHLEIGFELADYISQNLAENNEVPDFDYVLYKWALECTSVFALDTRLGALSNTTSKEAEDIIHSTTALFEKWANIMFEVPFWKYFNTKNLKKIHYHQQIQYDAVKKYLKLRSNNGFGKLEKIVQDSNLSESEKESIILDVLAAGVDTTSNAAAFVLYCLAVNPDKQEKLREEVNQVMDSGEEITGKTLQRMKYTHAVLQEVQRFFPFALGTIRKIDRDMVLSGYHVPKGTLVSLTANVTNNRDSAYFDEPDLFLPERWLKSEAKLNSIFVWAVMVLETSEIAPKSFSSIPSPKQLPLLGTLLDYTKYRNFESSQFFELMKRRHADLGPIYKENVIPGLTQFIVYIKAPEDIEAMFRSDPRFPFRPPQEFLTRGRELLGIHSGVANSQGEEWHKLRKVFNEHLLTSKSVWLYANHHLEIGFELADYISQNLAENNEVPDFDYVLYKWALECTSVFALDTRLGALSNTTSKEAEDIIHSTTALFEKWTNIMFEVFFWKYFITKNLKKIHYHQQIQYDAVKKYLKLRSNNGLGKLENILQDSNLSESEKESIILDVLAAGVDTTSNAAAFVLYCLAVNPDKQEKLREEVNQVMDSGEEITGKTLQRMKYTHAVLQEVQRFFPFTSGTIRKIDRDMVLSGYHVPKGSLVMLTANVTNNRDSAYFDEPDLFLPERWLKSGKQINRFAMSGSFGIGARKCPGRRFALQEVTCLVMALLHRYRIEYHHKPFESNFRIVTKPSQKSRFTFIPIQ